jgi:predicted nucleotidyltransferase component of viral defense system
MFKHAVAPELFLLIEKFSGIPEVADRFYLAGGTALALQFGHRRSDDLDFFSPTIWDSELLEEIILGLGGRVLQSEPRTLHSLIQGCKVSFLYYPYKIVYPFVYLGNLRLASVPEIGCMKAVAISQRAEKKDFFDMMEILQRYSAAQLKTMFLEKYGEAKINCYHILRSFFYFADVDDAPEPVSLNNTTWEQVKSYFLINEKVLTDELCLQE